jgi:urea carboxylase-associated protein 2
MANGSSDAQTSTLEQARAHARAQAGLPAATAPTVPATAAVDLPDGVAGADVVWDEKVGAGGYASRVLPRDTVLRITDIEGDACVQLMVYVAGRPWERLNVADTVKVQWQAYLDAGALLLSDMGRALLTMVEDTSGRHDCLCGGSNRRGNETRYGDGGISGPTPNARDLLALAGARFDLGRRDLAQPVNLFKGVRVDVDGALAFDGALRPHTHVDLRTELDVVVLVANTPHPLDPRHEYTATTVRCTAWRAPRLEPDRFRDATPERRRAFLNTEDLLMGVDR